MKYPAGWLVVLSLLPLLGGVPRRAAVPHPDRPDRQVETRDGFSVEYSPGQEAYVEAFFQRTPAFAAELEALREEALKRLEIGAPLSPADMHANREVILSAISACIGLEQPTELQEQAYDAFLSYYAKFQHGWDQMHLRVVKLLPRHYAIWVEDDLKTRLRNGQSVAGFSHDPATDSVTATWELQDNSEGPYNLREVWSAIDRLTLDHSFRYTIENGIATISGSVRLPGKNAIDPTRAPEQSPTSEESTAAMETAAVTEATESDSTTPFPILLDNEQDDLPSFEKVLDDSFAGFGGFARSMIASITLRNGQLVSVVLHETTEIGLLERYIGSADRRWLCDGTANYVAWRVARDRADPEFAREVYDLDDQLRQYAEFQKEIRLNAWPAAENMPKEETDRLLNRAHYAFATRAIFLLAERHGEALLAQLWREVGKTPRQQVSLQTVDVAYRKLRRQRLQRLVTDAERLPISSAATP